MYAALDGLIVLDKPVGITSAKALYRVRKVTGQRKSGHAGTLDPAASGVLLLCLGRATKLVERLMNLPKEYRARARLDATSASFDSDRPLLPVAAARIPTRGELEAAFARFVGTIEQVPPAVSAIKVGGRPAYKLERRGRPLELRPRPVRIDRLVVTHYEWPEVTFEMACGRGAYVRAVIRDVGAALGTGGCLTGLVRTRVGPFMLASAVGLAELEVAPSPLDHVLPLSRVEEMISDVPRDGGGAAPRAPEF